MASLPSTAILDSSLNDTLAIDSQSFPCSHNVTTRTADDVLGTVHEDEIAVEDGLVSASQENECRPKGWSMRRGKQLEAVRDALRQWRFDLQTRLYPSPLPASGYLPDNAKTPWMYVHRYGLEIIHLMHEKDRLYEEEHKHEVERGEEA